MTIFLGLMIPLLGTILGASCVFFIKDKIGNKMQKILLGFAGGVMIAASIWSLIIPSIEESSSLGDFSFIPAVVGLWIGILFVVSLDYILPHLHINEDDNEKQGKGFKRSTKLVLTVIIHNIPEGMAVGVVFAGWLIDSSIVSLTGAFILSIGIALQNFPEGAIVTMPLLSEGVSKSKAFMLGVISGIVEPIGALLMFVWAEVFTSVLPYFMSFAAGAMIYVVIEELVPEMSDGKHSHIGPISFAIGFSLMMVLDISLG